MKKIKYSLFPESGYTGDYDTKEGHITTKTGTVADLVIDTGLLLSADYDKVIPPHTEFNKMLLSGGSGRLGEWEPFQIDLNEYEEMVEYLISMPLPRPYRRKQVRDTESFLY